MSFVPMSTTTSTSEVLPMLASVILVVLCLIGFVVWGARHAYQERGRIKCPLEGRMARVLFRLRPDGVRGDVIRCSLRPGEAAVGCGEPCLAPRAGALRGPLLALGGAARRPRQPGRAADGH